VTQVDLWVGVGAAVAGSTVGAIGAWQGNLVVEKRRENLQVLGAMEMLELEIREHADRLRNGAARALAKRFLASQKAVVCASWHPLLRQDHDACSFRSPWILRRAGGRCDVPPDGTSWTAHPKTSSMKQQPTLAMETCRDVWRQKEIS
jgi:hypothetical protein